MTELNVQQFGPWAIVTGASAGLGAEFARQLAADGFNLVLVARREPELHALATSLEAGNGIETRVVTADLSRPEFMDTLVPETQDLDVGLLVSNAGSGVPGAFLDIPEAVLLNIVELNAVAHMRLVHHYGRLMVARGRGGILLVSAMGAQDGIPYMANDAATKSYIISLGQGLHEEFASSGVHTTVVMPGPTDTPVLEKFGLDVSAMPIKPMPAAQTVKEGLAALQANKATHLTGRTYRWMNRLVPAAVTRRMNSRMLSAGLENGQPRLSHVG